MKPLSERDENLFLTLIPYLFSSSVGMKPLSERDENRPDMNKSNISFDFSRNEATL